MSTVVLDATIDTEPAMTEHMIPPRYILRHSESGQQIGRPHNSVAGATRRARDMSRSVSHAVPVWWIDDTGKPKAEIGSAVAGIWLSR